MGSGFRDDRITVMLVHPWDASNHDDEWRAVLHEFDFGQLIAPGGPDRVLPVVVPTHFTFDGDHTVQLHLAKPNPVSGCQPATTRRFRLRLTSRPSRTRRPKRRSWPQR